MIWTVNFTRNGKSYKKSFSTWAYMMRFVTESKDIAVTYYE